MSDFITIVVVGFCVWFLFWFCFRVAAVDLTGAAAIGITVCLLLGILFRLVE